MVSLSVVLNAIWTGSERGMESVGGGWGRARQGRHGRRVSEREGGVMTRQLHSATVDIAIGL